MKILITGGAGFIGSNIAKKLMDRGDKVVIIDNFNDYYDPRLKYDRIKIYLQGYKFKLYKGDIRDAKLVDRIFRTEKIDKVIHLAAMAGVRNSLRDPKLYFDVNVMEASISWKRRSNTKSRISSSLRRLRCTATTKNCRFPSPTRWTRRFRPTRLPRRPTS